jgi:hypothetical protein
MSTPSFAAPGETRGLTIHVSDRVFAGLVDRARVAGYTPALYAKLLFEAAYAARCGKGEGDPLLEACVAKSLDRRPVAAPAPAVRPAETRGVHEAVAVPVPVLIPVPIPVPMRCEPGPAEALEVHISTGHSAEPSVAKLVGVLKQATGEHVGALLSAAAAKVARETEQSASGIPPRGWSASQWTFASLVCREEGVSTTEVGAALAPFYQDHKSICTLVSATRPKLRRCGIEIEAVDVWGWRTAPSTRAAADALIGRAA